MRKILDLYYEFGLRYILLDLDWKSFGQRFITILIRYFAGVGLKNTWTANLETIIIFYGIWTLKYLDCDFGLRLLYFTGFGVGNTWRVI